MKTPPLLVLAALCACLAIPARTLAQTGPFDPEAWPATVDPNKTVHYVVTDGGLTPPSATWLEGLTVLTGGDQITQDFVIGGHTGKKATSNNLNLADMEYAEWADEEFIDILVQVYGDAALLSAAGQPRNFTFLIGTLPFDPRYLDFPVGGQIAVEAKNKKWNWVLFRIPNGIRPDGERYCGSVSAVAQGATTAGGVNGGTIRFEGVPGLIVRVVAFGQQGAFGEPEDINKFVPAETCDPEPNTNLASFDLAANTSNHLEVMNAHDHTVTFADAVGPTGDKRRAAIPDGIYLNFGITDNYLGLPCNDPRTVKVCVDFYDHPDFAGMNVIFGPEAYATDAIGGIGFYPEANRQVLEGTGQWLRRSWRVPAVNLKGVNADAYTAGPRFVSINGQVPVSRVELAVLRVGDHPLAGQDPLATCYEDPNICTDKYGSFVELDLGKDIRDGLDVGTSGGDQEMIVAEAGPAGDRRQAVRPAREDGSPGFAHQNLNFAIQGEALGPNSQPPAQLAVCVTYYDDPELTGVHFRPEAYYTEINGQLTITIFPGSNDVIIEGSDTWRTAYWEVPNVKFNGVNQGPQAAARFFVGGKVFFTSVKYAVIRPCGPNAGVNLLEDCKPIADVSLAIERAGNDVKLSWPAAASDFVLQGAAEIAAPQWGPVDAGVEVVGDMRVVTVPIAAGPQFFRLIR